MKAHWWRHLRLGHRCHEVKERAWSSPKGPPLGKARRRLPVHGSRGSARGNSVAYQRLREELINYFFWSNNQIIKARSIYQICPKKCQKRYKMSCLNCRREATATGDDDIHRHVADDGPVKKLTQCSNCPGMWESQLLTYQLQLRRSPAINVRRRHWLTLCRATRNPANSTGGGQKHISFRCITGSCISFTWHAE